MDSLDKQDFFLLFTSEGAANVEELILDGMLSQKQLQDMGRALRQIVEGPLTQADVDRFNAHRLRSVTFIKPQEYNEEIQALEALL